MVLNTVKIIALVQFACPTISNSALEKLIIQGFQRAIVFFFDSHLPMLFNAEVD